MGNGWGYLYMIELTNGYRPPPAQLTIGDLHLSDDCGPILVMDPTGETPTNCDRDYRLGASYQSFIDSKAHLWLLQDSHDPNDNAFTHTRFAEINIPPGTTAELHCFVPSCDDNDAAGHCATQDDLPAQVDPVVDSSHPWTEPNPGETYTENNGIARRHFTKTVEARHYVLHHTTHLGW